MLTIHPVENTQRLTHELATRPAVATSFPAVMYIESTRGCPYGCIMCKVPEVYGRKVRQISGELLKKIEPYFQYLELLGIHGQGEPLLTRQLDFFINASQKHQFYLHMNTTGFFLKPKIADQLLDAKLSIRFSIHAGTEQGYAKIMGNELERVTNNIGYLIARNQSNGHENNDFWFSFIVMKENINEIDDFLYLADRTGIRKVRFMALTANKRLLVGARRDEPKFTFKYFDQANRAVNQKFLQKLPQIRELAKKLGISIEKGTMENASSMIMTTRRVVNRVERRLMHGNNFVSPLIKRHGNCIVPWAGQVRVGVDGMVKLCCNTSYTLGNLNERDFAEIWNDHQIRSVRNGFGKGHFPRVCGYCEGIREDEYPKGVYPST